MGKTLTLIALLLVAAMPVFGQTVVQTATGTCFGSSCTVYIPATTAGNLLVYGVVAIRSTTNATVNPPVNFTSAINAADANAGDAITAQIGYRANAPSTTDVGLTTSLGSTTIRMFVLEISGADATSPLDRTSFGFSFADSVVGFTATSTLTSSPQIAVNLAGDTGGYFCSWTGGETERADIGYLAGSTQALASTSAYTAGGYMDGVSNVVVGLTATFKEGVAVATNSMLVASD